MNDIELAEEIERYLAPDASYHDWLPSMADMEQIIAALRQADLAQTEIKGHLRLVDELRGAAEAELDLRMQVERDLGQAQARIAELEKALKIIERWSEFPATGDFHPGGTPVSYGAAFGSNGERDYMRSIASAALTYRA